MSLLTNVNVNNRLSENEQNEYQTRVKENVLPYATIATPQDKINPTLLGMFTQGSTWKVTYYRQILGRDEEPMAQSMSQTGVYQQYDKIENFPIRLSSPITHQQNDQDRIFTAEGSGVIMPAFGPNGGDMLIGDAGDGRMGLFTISYMLRNTALKYSTYEVKFTWVCWMNKERQADFDRKTNNVYVFDANGWANGCGPFMTKSQEAVTNSFMARLPEMIETYCDDFLSKSHSTFIVPDQAFPTYDHFVTCFLLQLIGREWSDKMIYVDELNVTNNRLIRESKTIWDALLDRRKSYLTTGVQHVLLGDMRTLKGRPEFRSAAYSGIPFLVIPYEHSTHVDEKYRFEDLAALGFYPYRAGQVRRRATLADAQPADKGNRPEYQSSEGSDVAYLNRARIKPVNCDIGYVLSDSFYTNASDQSQLEIVVSQIINHDTIDEKLVANLVEDAYNWTNLDRFYYHPILMFIMLLYIRRLNNG